MLDVGLKELDAVLAVARCGTFRAAAIDLDVSTTALSHTIARLEAGLGVRLFNRTTRSVSLTDAGRLFVGTVGPSVQDLRNALGTVQAHRETPTGTLRINAAPFAARAIMQPLVIAFLTQYPDMHVDLVTEGRMVDIVRDGFDLGVRLASLVPSDMIAVPLGDVQRHAVVATAAFLERHGTPQVPTDLLRQPCIRIRLPDGSLFRWRFEKDGQQVLIDVSGPLSLDDASLVRSAVFNGMGVGYFIEADIIDDINAGRLVRVLEDWTPSSAGLCLYYPGRRNLSAGMRAFLDLARTFARQAPGPRPAAE
ncbi:LysR family transcriptional regulator [Rhizobium sp. SG2393]|uniref:LysR family transcriptional regulator n=1 Tax=Rhizobium sp. SG2393 TaxID=3276279 RepID=UPI003672CF63